eukprot:500528-Prymnesium_polylepis.2
MLICERLRPRRQPERERIADADQAAEAASERDGEAQHAGDDATWAASDAPSQRSERLRLQRVQAMAHTVRLLRQDTAQVVRKWAHEPRRRQQAH